MGMRIILLYAGVMLAGAFTPTPVAAQEPSDDCGEECVRCGLFGWGREGEGLSEEGLYNMNCQDLQASCDGCQGAQNLVGPSFLSASDLVSAVQGAPKGRLESLVSDHGARLLLNESRNLLVVKGTSCNEEALTAVLFLSEERTREFVRLGLTSIEEHLERGL